MLRPPPFLPTFPALLLPILRQSLALLSRLHSSRSSRALCFILSTLGWKENPLVAIRRIRLVDCPLFKNGIARVFFDSNQMRIRP